MTEEKKEEKKETAEEIVDRVAAEETADEESAEKSALDEAKEVLKGITEQNKIMADNIKKAEKIQADIMLAGKTPAGAPSGPTTEEKEIAAAKSLIAGTGFEDRLFPEKK